MADFFGIAPGEASYTTTSYGQGGYGSTAGFGTGSVDYTSAGGYASGTGGYTAGGYTAGGYTTGGYNTGGYTTGTEEIVTTTTATTTPIVNTQVLNTGIETNFGTNTADGYFGGQADIVAEVQQTQNYDYGGSYFGEGSNIITTVAPVQTVVENRVTAPPAPVYQPYQDYSTDYYDYEEPPKKKSFCNLRNALLGCLGLLLLGGLLGGLLGLLKWFKNRPAKPIDYIQPPIIQPLIIQPIPEIIPIKPLPTIIPTVPDVVVTPDVPIAPPTSTVITQPVRPYVSTYVQPATATFTTTTTTIVPGYRTVLSVDKYGKIVSSRKEIVDRKYTPEELNAALQNAIASGNYTNDENYAVSIRNAFRNYYSNDDDFNRAVAIAFEDGHIPNTVAPYADTQVTTSTGVSFLTGEEIQSLVDASKQHGKLTESSIAKLGLSAQATQALIQHAQTQGFLNSGELVNFSMGPRAVDSTVYLNEASDTPITTVLPTSVVEAEVAAFKASHPSVPTLTPAHVQELLAYKEARGNFNAEALQQLGLTEDQFNLMLDNSLESGLITADQRSSLRVGGFRQAISDRASKIGNAISETFNRAIGRDDEHIFDGVPIVHGKEQDTEKLL